LVVQLGAADASPRRVGRSLLLFRARFAPVNRRAVRCLKEPIGVDATTAGSWPAIGLALGIAVICWLTMPFPHGLAALSSIPIGLIVFLLARWASNGLIVASVVSIVVLALLSFVASAACDIFLGGTTLLGKTDGNFHYLGSHGHYTRVDQTTYRAVMVPDLVVAALWPSLPWLLAAKHQYSRNSRARQR
jgi:hypothetical protein